jgi:hypothetical protein
MVSTIPKFTTNNDKKGTFGLKFQFFTVLNKQLLAGERIYPKNDK